MLLSPLPRYLNDLIMHHSPVLCGLLLFSLLPRSLNEMAVLLEMLQVRCQNRLKTSKDESSLLQLPISLLQVSGIVDQRELVTQRTQRKSMKIQIEVMKIKTHKIRNQRNSLVSETSTNSLFLKVSLTTILFLPDFRISFLSKRLLYVSLEKRKILMG